MQSQPVPDQDRHLEPWLQEILDRHALKDLRHSTLNRGRAIVRRRRQLRRPARVTDVVAGLFGTTLLFSWFVFQPNPLVTARTA